MGNNSVVIATNAAFLADTLRGKLREAEFRVSVANNENELEVKIKTVFPRFIFIEHCFYGDRTEIFVKQLAHGNRTVSVVVWTVSEVKPRAAARFIVAGAESYFSLRETEQTVEMILCRIAGGRPYCPACVEKELDKGYESSVGEAFTEREIEIFKLTAKKKDNREIGETMSLSVNTVKFHFKNIYSKSDCEKRFDLMVYGLRNKILNEEDFT